MRICYPRKPQTKQTNQVLMYVGSHFYPGKLSSFVLLKPLTLIFSHPLVIFWNAFRLLVPTITLPEKRSLPDGCHDADGVHHSVGEGWKVESGYCKCYELGNIWCVGDPVTAPPRRLRTSFWRWRLRPQHHFWRHVLHFYSTTPCVFGMMWPWNFNNSLQASWLSVKFNDKVFSFVAIHELSEPTNTWLSFTLFCCLKDSKTWLAPCWRDPMSIFHNVVLERHVQNRSDLFHEANWLVTIKSTIISSLRFLLSQSMSARTRDRATRQENISLTDVFGASVMEGGVNISVQRMTVNIKDCR